MQRSSIVVSKTASQRYPRKFDCQKASPLASLNTTYTLEYFQFGSTLQNLCQQLFKLSPNNPVCDLQRSPFPGQQELITQYSPNLPTPVLSARATSKVFTTHFPIPAHILQFPFCEGYYADPEAQCQAFHICGDDGRGGLAKYSFLCPNGTVFNQQYFICDWWFNVDCSQVDSSSQSSWIIHRLRGLLCADS